MKFSDWKNIIKTTFIEFSRERPFLHGAALSYYALMALIPLLYLSITFFGMVVGHDTMLNIIASILRNQIGLEDISGIISFLDEVDLGSGSLAMEILGILALMFSCTAIINSLKKSIDDFYDLDRKKMNKKTRLVRGVLFRFGSMILIVAITVLVIALYFAETVFLSLGNHFFEDLKFVSWIFSSIARHGIPILMNFIIFSFVFKYLHAGYVKWKVAAFGGLVTGMLLYFGQLLIKYYLMNYFFAASGGVAGTMLIILVWVYYSSQILFLGAKFTAVYSNYKGYPILLT